MGKQVVDILETATGGKVELGALKFDLWHLSLEADHLVIHGLEGPGEAPYLAADKILVRIKIMSFLQHTTGTGVASHIGLSPAASGAAQRSPHHRQERQDQPARAQAPHSQSTEPLQDTLLDLKAKEVELVHGVALVNDRAIPFNLAAADLNATVQYLRATDRYGATIDLRDLRTQMAKEPEAKSSLHLEAQIGRDMAQLTKPSTFTPASTPNSPPPPCSTTLPTRKWQAQAVGLA